MTCSIPSPPGWPFLGHVTSIDKDCPYLSFHRFSKDLGEIYKLNLLGRHVVFVSSYNLVNELSDDRRFKKAVGGALKEVRNLVNDGIFTAYNHEPNWGIAHRLLTPAFGARPVADMLEDMRTTCLGLVEKWKQYGPDDFVDPLDDLTRVALDSLADCAMSYKLNSFATATEPPFACAMLDFLRECNDRANRPWLMHIFMWGRNTKYQRNIDLLRGVALDIRDRSSNPSVKHDLLSHLLHGTDSKGYQLSDQSIVDNLLTLLIAGHETTASAMSFTLYYLLKYPKYLRQVRAEIDGLIADQPAQYSDLTKMHHLIAAIKEALRLQPPAVVRVVYPVEDTVLGNGRFHVAAGQPIVLQIWDSHRDTLVWGEDAGEFRPERMANFDSLPPNAWQPFGFGARGCIGKLFSWQEMLLVLSTLIQTFDMQLADPSYTLQVSQAITIKPTGMFIRVRRRPGHDT